VTAIEHRARAPWWPVVPVLCVAALLYLHSFGETPIYLGGDEARFATAANSIARTGRNLNGDRLPLFFHLTDSLDRQQAGTRWYQPVLFYAMALVLKVAPLSETAIRVPTVIIGLLDIFLVYGVARRLLQTPFYPALAATMLALTPAHLLFSRQALDYICPLPFVLGWLWCCLVALETGSPRFSFAAGLLLGVGFYSYIAAWVVMPALAVVTCVAQLTERRRAWLAPVAVIAGFALPVLAFVPWLWFHPEMWRDTVGRYKVYDAHLSPLQGVKDFLNYNNIQERISVYWDYFNPAFLFFSGGSNLTHGTRRAGVFLLPVGLFLAVGIPVMWNRRPRFASLVLLAGLALAPVPATLVDERYAIQRALLMLPFAVLISVFGVAFLLQRPNRLVRLATVVLLAAVPVQYAFFHRDYFADYRVRSAFWFDPVNFRGVAEFLIANDPPDSTRRVYLSEELDDGPARWMFYLAKHHREDLLSRTRLFTPHGYDLSTIPAGSLLVLYANDPSMASFTKGNACAVAGVVTHAGSASSAVILRKAG
jgi:4-amino-4-deoxy-L-arabinose transferase-like glycosyltransferase